MSPVRKPHLRLIAKNDASESPVAPAAPALDDSALLARMASKDPMVALAFYQRVRPIVDRTLSRLLGSRDPDYEDVAQVALFELVSTIHRFRGECPLDAWLSVVSARVAYRQIRRRRLERKLFANAQLEEVASTLAVRPIPFEARQAIRRVHDHLHEMDDKRAWTWLLHDVHGYDLKEISQIMDASLSAAQSRLVRGRRELHERIRSDHELAGYLDTNPDADREVTP
ncbi:MAG TPA: RNA polymerase sigma factor [Polyangiaceae bacterium]|jgi:RNA polymerase sigma-70 factor (ECF subfamily)|nr:RNA polymerase sigma factor [Polyangiaceae bacterium]